jgi:signal transduction histidine kinase
MVILNLAINARDAMAGKGPLTISVETVACPEGTDAVLVALGLADQGTGMDAATLARATEPFFTTKGIGKGTGLGLAMARRFAEESGGRLVTESELGQGTKITILLPVHRGGAD